jgi:hypothetical protein
LVAALADPDRGWDAVVIGEYERASYDSQYAAMAPLFEHYGIQLWTPEVGGRIDFHAEDVDPAAVLSADGHVGHGSSLSSWLARPTVREPRGTAVSAT